MHVIRVFIKLCAVPSTADQMLKTEKEIAADITIIFLIALFEH